MVKSTVNLFAVLYAAVCLLACSSANNKPLLIGFSADSSAIVFNDIDQSGLLQLKTGQNADSLLHSLVSVLESPSEKDTAIKEAPVEGRFKVSDSNLVFIPAMPFVKGRDYLVITHLNTRFGELKDVMNGGLSNRIKPVSKLLTR
ncbi:hypothetical protein ABIE26_004541 [Pedobacter africanus]|uniref:Uncharacterized protein n=1 Tax=Pedobacter africanus TaxID=151894 RepID=A0ACC6L3C3_9SPHI|nr:hypothetical protein [Pedobacter africanus]MDR6785989.1 hypothetical protein [Pedobacter africanus]